MLQTEAPSSDIALSGEGARPALPFLGDKEIPLLSARISQQELLMNGPLQLCKKEICYMNLSKPRDLT